VLTKLCFNDSRLAYNNLSGQIPGSLFQVARYKYAKFALNVHFCYYLDFFLIMSGDKTPFFHEQLFW
jgi:hypothetical protein